MWVLIILMAGFSGGVHAEQVMFDTEAKCQAAEEIMGFEVKTSNPLQGVRFMCVKVKS